jgi:hypothetical protein
MIDQYIYDGSFEGFLTAVFEVYDRKPTRVKIVSERLVTENFFDEEHTVYTDQVKSDRVWKGIEDKIGKKAGKSHLQSIFK